MYYAALRVSYTRTGRGIEPSLLTVAGFHISLTMLQMNKGILFAIGAGIVGIFFATFGFLRTIMIMFLVMLGYLVGSYLETKKKD